jgi:hypothetical protein
MVIAGALWLLALLMSTSRIQGEIWHGYGAFKGKARLCLTSMQYTNMGTRRGEEEARS